jgi:hypothetical protein
MAMGAALALALPGCATLGLALSRALPDRGHECPGPLVPTEEMHAEFLLEQDVRVQGDGLDWALTLVSQKRGPTLVLVGLDPFGAKLFTLTQRGTEISVERPGGRLPLPPVNLLRDLHRARFGRPGAPLEPGVTIESLGPGSVRIQHAECGYETTLVTLKEQALDAP